MDGRRLPASVAYELASITVAHLSGGNIRPCWREHASSRPWRRVYGGATLVTRIDGSVVTIDEPAANRGAS